MIHSIEPYEYERLFDVRGEEPESKVVLTLTLEELAEIKYAAYQGALHARHVTHDKISDRLCSAVSQQFGHLVKQLDNMWEPAEPFRFVPPDAVYAPVELPEVRFFKQRALESAISREKAERLLNSRYSLAATEVLRDC